MKNWTVAVAIIGLIGAVVAADPVYAQTGTGGPAHGIAMHGAPKYPSDFTHFVYVNPDAPKGGTMVQFGGATFDSLNQFIVNGDPAAGMGLIYDTLTVAAADEAFTRYCLLCETMEVPDDRSWVEFVLREDAKWHDGTPITVDDVIFSYEILTTEGHPFYQFYYGNIANVEQTGDRSVRFEFGGETNLELPLIISELTILPKHYWEGRDFGETTLEPPLGSGAYRVKELDAGSSIAFERVEDYWAAGLPVNVGQGNFDEIRYEFFRDPQIAREAFKGGEIDFWLENQSKAWATAYDISAVEDGLIILEESPHNRSAGMQGFVINTRRDKFSDPRLREALSYAFDFEWTNRELFYGAYTRTDSYFENSELASSGALADAGAEEREILEARRGDLPEEVFTDVFSVPETSGQEGGARTNIGRGGEILTEAGWPIVDGKRVNSQTGETLTVELLLVSQQFERIALPFVENLKRMGVDASARLVDQAQYTRRLDEFDFDMVITTFGQSLSPGNEQRSFWGSETAEISGSRNLAGIKDPVIDELLELVISAPSRESLIQRTRALDRVLLWGYYVIPNWHVPHDRIAYWDMFGKPGVVPARGVQIGAWWVDPQRLAALDERVAAVEGDAGPDGSDGPGGDVVADEVADSGLGEATDETGGFNLTWLVAGVVAALVALLVLFRRRKKA
jgi:microcin C transport system substrate-binding protein